MDKLKEIEEFIKTYEVGHYVFKNLIRHKFKISLNEVSNVLEILVTKGFLQHEFCVVCADCGFDFGCSYDRTNDITSDIENWCCPDCGKIIDKKEDIELYYKRV